MQAKTKICRGTCRLSAALLLLFAATAATRGKEAGKSVGELKTEAREAVAKQFSPERVAEHLGIAWPPVKKSDKTRQDVEAEIKRELARNDSRHSPEELRREAEILYRPWKKGERVTVVLDAKRGYKREGMITEIYPHMFKVGGHWLRMADVSDDVKAHFDAKIRKKRIAAYVRKALRKQDRQSAARCKAESAETAKRIFTEAGFYRVRGKWYSADELKKAIEAFVEKKRAEELPKEIRRLMAANGYVRCGGRWTAKSTALEAMENHRLALVASAAREEKKPPSLKQLADSIVLVKVEMGGGNIAQGTGFVIFLDDSEYLVTNQHVIVGAERCRFTTLNGARLHPTAYEFHPNLDLVRMRFEVAGRGLVRPLLPALAIPDIGDPIYVFGNSKGAEVATTLSGEVQGLAPDRLEVSASFVEGNSGSPILTADGRVAAVATYAMIIQQVNALSKGTRFAKPRRFGLRLGNGMPFVCRDVRTFMSQGQLLEDLDNYLGDVFSMLGQGLPFMEAYDLRIQVRRYHNPVWPKRVYYLIHNKGFLDIMQSRRSLTADEARQLVSNVAEAMTFEINVVRKTLNQTRWVTGFLAGEGAQKTSVCNMLITLMGIWKGQLLSEI